MKRLIVLVLIALATASSNASYPEQQMPMSQSYTQSLDIQHYVKDKEIKVLNAGEQEFITLIKEETSGFPRGIAFIIPEVNQSISRQASMNSVYDQLNNYGWTSLLLTMPSRDVLSETVNLIEEQAKVTPDQDTNLSVKASHTAQSLPTPFIENVEADIEKRINAAWQLAEQYPGFFLFICQGRSCGWVTSLIQQQRLKAPDALVMLSAHLPQSDLNDNFSLQLSKTNFPVLDLYKDLDSPWVTEHILQRKKHARKNYKTDYRQRKVNTGFGYQAQQQRTIKEIYGFLTSVGM